MCLRRPDGTDLELYWAGDGGHEVASRVAGFTGLAVFSAAARLISYDGRVSAPFLLAALLCPAARAASPSRDEAARFASLALKCATTEFPNKQDHIADDAGDLARPRDAHPAFYGCLDWHSSVHGHWLMVRALRLYPDLPDAARLRAVLDVQLSTTAVAGELGYLARPSRKAFERTYGWAWLLKLDEELRGWDDPDARRWSAALKPLAAEFSRRYESFLPKLTYPLRVGAHPRHGVRAGLRAGLRARLGRQGARGAPPRARQGLFRRGQELSGRVGARREGFLLARPARGGPDETDT